MVLLGREKSFTKPKAVWIQYTSVTDGRTDGRTDIGRPLVPRYTHSVARQNATKCDENARHYPAKIFAFLFGYSIGTIIYIYIYLYFTINMVAQIINNTLLNELILLTHTRTQN